MTTVMVRDFKIAPERSHPASAAPPGRRAHALADRLEQGARALATVAGILTNTQWQTRIPGDGRTIGVVVHHVGSAYSLGIRLARRLAAGRPVLDVTMADIGAINAAHARMYDGVTKLEALNLLWRKSTTAAAAIRALSDEELNRTAPVSLYANAPITCQFMLERHAVRHSYHHLAGIWRALKV